MSLSEHAARGKSQENKKPWANAPTESESEDKLTACQVGCALSCDAPCDSYIQNKETDECIYFSSGLAEAGNSLDRFKEADVPKTYILRDHGFTYYTSKY